MKGTCAAKWLLAVAPLAACQPSGGGNSNPPPDPVLNAVLIPGPRITFARPGATGFEVLPSSAVILRLTSAWPLDGERVEVTLTPFTGGGPRVGPLAWVRRDDNARKATLASVGYIETVVDGFGYSVILTPPPAFLTGTGFDIALRTSQGGTAASPAAYSQYLSVGVRPRVARVPPSAVFFDCNLSHGGVGNWNHTCKNGSSIVARDVALEGWLRGPSPNYFGGNNDPIWVEDWHYDFGPDPDFIEQMYGPNGAFSALGDNSLASAVIVGNPPGTIADGIRMSDLSATGQPIGITVNSFLQPDNRPDATDVTDNTAVMKAELNAWHSMDQDSPRCGAWLGFCRHWIGRGPPPSAAWIALPQSAYPAGVDATAASNAYWAYDPRLLQQGTPLGAGEYVRMVGTLWQDADHAGVTRWYNVRPAFGGWMEIHPPDWIVRVNPPAVPKSLRVVELVTGSAAHVVDSRTLTPADTPQPGQVLRCRERIDGRFTWPASVVQHTATVSATDVTVQTTVRAVSAAGASTSQPGRFKAAYILWWEAGAVETSCRAG